MSKTLAIIGAGTSINEIPRDYRFTVDTMALNAGTIIPQFYDMVTEQWVKSWTYSMFIDSEFGKNYYFPESYAFKQSLKNTDGITYLLQGNFTIPEADNIRWVKSKVAGGSVLCPALLEAPKLGYDRLVLFGCDYCRRGDHRHWWETDDNILHHPKNNTLVPAKSDRYDHKQNGRVIIYNRRKPEDWQLLEPLTTSNGETVYADNSYLRQMAHSNEILDKLRGDGMEIFKWGEWGLLDIPSIGLDKLE